GSDLKSSGFSDTTAKQNSLLFLIFLGSDLKSSGFSSTTAKQNVALH
ncbi:MAG: hypothetical protein ACI9W5_000846, partial [Ulvibacter sp.]